MTVEILPLSGLSAAAAKQAADALLDLDTGPDRLERLLVLDDTALLDEHASVYQHIDTANRVEKLLCVTVGPRAGGARTLELPGNLGGVQGWPVLWVSRPGGINWRVAKAAVANRHPGATPTALDQHPLVKLVSVDEMFDRLHQKFLAEVPGRVANPGLWLAGADDEAATFAGALAVAIRRVCEPGPGSDGPFGDLLPARAGGASLSESGPFARYLARIAEMDHEATRALERAGGLGGVFKRGDSGVQRYVVKVGAALTDLRDLIVQVLRDASVAGTAAAMTANQRDLVRNVGLEFEAEAGARQPSRTAGSAVEQSLVYRTVAGAVTGGDSIPLVAKRLTATERQVTRHGSASYLPEVERRCPPALLARLADPPQRLSRHAAVMEARRELGLDEASAAAQALTDLALAVANREWSPTSVTPRDLAGSRAALDGTRKALTEHASMADSVRGGTRGARLSRLGDSLLPVLCDLVLHAVGLELASPSASGQEALRAAHDRAAGMLAEWTRHVQADGVAGRPSFASSSAHDSPHVIEDDVAAVREAVLYPARDEMWQLCAPADLSALDVDAPLVSIRFASRLNREAIIGTIPGDEPVWTSAGSFAGLLRLVPLRAGVAQSTWGKADAGRPAVTEP
jgi:hypothetical protein